MGHPFFVSRGRAQHYLGVTPDLYVQGKAFGAGMPIGALVGKRDVMRLLKLLVPSQMSGTYLAHLTGVMAALAALDEYAAPGFHTRLFDVAGHFYRGFAQHVVSGSGAFTDAARFAP